MKILHISDYFSSKLGYQEFNLARCHSAVGHDVIVISSDRYYPFPNYENSYQRILGDRIIKTKIRNEDRKFGYNLIRIKPIFEYAKSAFIIMPSLLPYLKKTDPDLIISHDLLSPSTFWACQYKRKHKQVRLILDTHAAEYNTKFDRLIKKIYLLLWKVIIRDFVLKYADGIVAIGESEKEFAEKYLFCNSKANIVIRPLGTDVTKFSFNSSARNQLRKKLGIKNDEVVFINAGKINNSKKNLIVLKIFAKLARNNPAIKLLFLGDGDQNYIRKMRGFVINNQLQKRVIFIDMVPNDELPLYFSASDIGVWPGSPSNVFYEAMACRLPIIVQKRKDKIIEGNGYAVESKSELENAMIKLLDSTRRTDMGKKSRKLAVEKYSWSSIANNFIKLIED